MTVFTSAGLLDLKVIAQRRFNDLAFMSPASWVVGTGVNANNLNNLPGGIMVYNGSPPKIIKL